MFRRISINPDPYTDADMTSGDAHEYFALHDAMFSVIGLADSDGALVERYEYTPYGKRRVYKSAGLADPLCMAPTFASQRPTLPGDVPAAWALCDIGHQGLAHDARPG